MRRREFVALFFCGLVVTRPLGAHAQQATRTIGFLSSRSPGESAALVAAFR
jgi:hypothetical protein